jgi:uncharacterized circularly permuted ATP-grasp superfamily protein
MSSGLSDFDAALCQRVRLYERLLADAYGPQQALSEGWYAGELLWAAPGYLRALHGVPAPGARLWAVRFEITQAGGPVRAFLQGLPVAPLMFKPLGQAVVLKAAWDDPQAQGLAQASGLPCVPHTRLQVEGDQLMWLDAPVGAQRVQQVLRTASDDQLDPLELAGDPATGVPGLTQLLRTGNVQVMNFPGAAWLEAPWVEAQRASLCRAALGENAVTHAGPVTNAIVQRTFGGELVVQHLP